MPKPYFHTKQRHIAEILRVDHAGEYGAVRIYQGQIDALNSTTIGDFCVDPALESSRTQKYAPVLPSVSPINPSTVASSGNNTTSYRGLFTEMQSHEQRHLDYFTEEIGKRHSRPTLLLPLWHSLGYAMGYVSALWGIKTAMLCTEAVEEVIDEHYQKQQITLSNMEESKLSEKIEEHRLEELSHKDIAIEHGSLDAPMHFFIKTLISKICKLAIFSSKII